MMLTRFISKAPRFAAPSLDLCMGATCISLPTRSDLTSALSDNLRTSGSSSGHDGDPHVELVDGVLGPITPYLPRRTVFDEDVEGGFGDHVGEGGL